MATAPFNFTAALDSTTAFPAEVALCLSYRATLQSGVNPARLKGRLYIGPLNGSIGLADGDVRPSTGMQQDVARAGNALRIAGLGAGADNVTWCVYSPTAGFLQPVVSCWVDNAFDTMRRRGAKPLSRFSLP